MVGGSDKWSMLDSAELYDPLTETWSYTGKLNAFRNHPVAALLANGQVLVAGTGTSAELYDPAIGRWTLTGPTQNLFSADTANAARKWQGPGDRDSWLQYGHNG